MSLAENLPTLTSPIRVGVLRWTPTMDCCLIAMRGEGFSSSAIGEQLGITRNAVIGRAHRLNLPKIIREVRGRRPRRATGGQRTKRRQIGIAGIDDTPDIETPVEQRKSLLELNASTCRWPVGDPCMDDFFFCGAEPASGFPYCAKHAIRARK